MSEIQYVSGDLFEALKAAPFGAQTTILPHVVNSQGAFGAGFVVPLSKAFPHVKEAYLEWHKDGVCNEKDEALGFERIPFKIGETQFVVAQTDPQMIVANMIAQHLGGIRPLMYNHLAKCMDRVAEEALRLKARIIAPMFGSMLAGGDWGFIEDLIEDCWLDKELDVTIFYLPGKTPPGWTPPQST